MCQKLRSLLMTNEESLKCHQRTAKLSRMPRFKVADSRLILLQTTAPSASSSTAAEIMSNVITASNHHEVDDAAVQQAVEEVAAVHQRHDESVGRVNKALLTLTMRFCSPIRRGRNTTATEATRTSRTTRQPWPTNRTSSKWPTR